MDQLGGARYIIYGQRFSPSVFETVCMFANAAIFRNAELIMG